MSTVEDRSIACPACGLTEVRSIARSLNTGRSPAWLDALRDETLHRFTCSCGVTFTVEDPLLLVDFERRWWFGMYPPDWHHDWKRLQEEVQQSWATQLIHRAPTLLREQATHWKVRTVFGLDSLREKAVLFDAGLSDASVEALKLTLLRDVSGLSVTDLRLRTAHDDTLAFRGQAGGRGVDIEVARSKYARIALDPLEWTPTLAAVTQGTYVDVGAITSGPQPQRPQYPTPASDS